MTDIFEKSYQRHLLQRVGAKCRTRETLSTPAPRHSATSTPAALCPLTASARQLTALAHQPTARAWTRPDASPGTGMPAPRLLLQHLNVSGRGHSQNTMGRFSFSLPDAAVGEVSL